MKNYTQANVKIVAPGDAVDLGYKKQEFIQETSVEMTDVVVLMDGTEKKQPTVMVVGKLKDGRRVVFETTGKLFYGIAMILRGASERHGKDVGQ